MLDGMESSDEHDEGDFICLAGEREKKCPHGRFDSRDSCNFHYLYKNINYNNMVFREVTLQLLL